MTNLEKIYFVLIIVFGKNSVICDLNFYQNLHKTCNFAKINSNYLYIFIRICTWFNLIMLKKECQIVS